MHQEHTGEGQHLAKSLSKPISGLFILEDSSTQRDFEQNCIKHENLRGVHKDLDDNILEYVGIVFDLICNECNHICLCSIGLKIIKDTTHTHTKAIHYRLYIISTCSEYGKEFASVGD